MRGGAANPGVVARATGAKTARRLGALMADVGGRRIGIGTGTGTGAQNISLLLAGVTRKVQSQTRLPVGHGEFASAVEIQAAFRDQDRDRDRGRFHRHGVRV